jgi:hypothetical protein
MPEGIFNIIKELKGKLRESDSEVVRRHSYRLFKRARIFGKRRENMSRNSKDLLREIADEVDMLDIMFS